MYFKLQFTINYVLIKKLLSYKLNFKLLKRFKNNRIKRGGYTYFLISKSIRIIDSLYIISISSNSTL